MTELEMNSTYRGAVEVFNLCCNLDQSDVLRAECIRTFNEHAIDGRSWMNSCVCAQLKHLYSRMLAGVPSSVLPLSPSSVAVG